MQRVRRIAEELHAVTLREAVREVARGYRAHDLLVFASSIAFHVLFAIIPLVLFGLGLLGGLGLGEQWTSEWAPDGAGVDVAGGVPGRRRDGAARARPAAGLLDDGRRGARRVEDLVHNAHDHGRLRSHLLQPP